MDLTFIEVMPMGDMGEEDRLDQNWPLSDLRARLRTRYTLTELGEEVVRVADKAEELIEDLAGRVQGGPNQLEGEIRVTVLPEFSAVLMPAIARFRAENPGCRVSIIASEDLARLEYGEAHIALRTGPRPDHPDYVVALYAHIGLNLYAHDSYVQRKGMPSERDLAGHEFVVPNELKTKMPFSDWVAENVDSSQIAVATSHYGGIATAVEAGLGLGVLVDPEVASRSDLHPVLPKDQAWAVPVWLATHVDLHRTKRVQAMLKCIRATREANLSSPNSTASV